MDRGAWWATVHGVTQSQTRLTLLRSSSRMNWEIGSDTYTMLCIKQINNENLLYSTGNTVLCCDLNGKEIQKRGIYVCMYLIHFAV